MRKQHNILLKIMIILPLLLLNSCRNPTSPSEKALRTLWEKTYGGEQWDEGSSVQETSDGGLIIGGFTGPYYLLGLQMYLIKTDSQGRILWTKTFEGECYYNFFTSVKETSDDGFIIIGTIYSDSTNHDVYIIKTDKKGNILWTKSYGGALDENVYAGQETSDGGCIVAGSSFLSSPSYEICVYVIKTDENGYTLWTKTYMEGTGYSIQETSDRGYILTGIAKKTYGSSTPYLFLMKINKNGEALWTKISGFAAGNSVKETTDGGYIITGWKMDYAGDDKDVYLIKTDANGSFVWEKTYGGRNDDIGYSVLETHYGGYIISGYTTSYGGDDEDVYLIKTDSYGNLLWSNKYGGEKDDRAYSIQATSDGGYIVVGNTSSFGAGLSDIYLIKLQE